jgi:hypothetical protein
MGLTITISVPWRADPDDHSDNQPWNELLAWTVETYGLPGDRVTFHPGKRNMYFVFTNENDALMFQLKSGGSRRTNDDWEY